MNSSKADILKDYPNLSEFLPFLEALNTESPRGRVLISTGFLEQLLEDVLRAFMVEDTADELFRGGNAPLATLSVRIRLCRALGLISDDEASDIHTLRKIRNEFAHETKAAFDQPKIRDWCKALRFKAPDYGSVALDAQAQFTSAATCIILNLVNRPHYVSEKRLSYTAWKI